MKVLAINGSPHREGSTYLALKTVADKLAEKSIKTDILHIGKIVNGCIACGACRKAPQLGCVAIKDDVVNEAITKMQEADALMIGSPVYFAGIAGSMKCFLDRFFYAGVKNCHYKVGLALCAVRRSGGVTTFDQLNHYLAYANMAIVSSHYWPVIHGQKGDEVLHDAEGVQSLRRAGNNMAWLLKSLKDSVKPTFAEEKVWTNFIR
jgi:multimeric flavodoxin WrbA